MKAAVPIVLPNVNERRHVHIINPTAGGRKFYSAAVNAIDKIGEEKIESTSGEHLRSLVAETLRKDPYAHVTVYGGDGSVYYAVNGIMDSGSAATASFSVIPCGSGNDFSSFANDGAGFKKGELNRIDLISVTRNGRRDYFANMMNIGFDCAVVKETYTLKKKPFLKGPTAYIAGVLKVLAVKKTTPAKIKLSGCVSLDSGKAVGDIEVEKDILLTACANGRYCGGGFNAASQASLNDRLMDVLIVNDISRAKFISMIGNYKKGDYITSDGKLLKSYEGVIDYCKCEKMEITGPELICLDGEVMETGREERIISEVCPGAVWFAAV
jgi:diacylglycerol kinase (ATP)